MCRIADYLNDNPDYYIEGGKLSSSVTPTKENIDHILNGFKTESCTIPPGYRGFKLKKEGNDIGYVSYTIHGDDLKIHYVKINDGNNQFGIFNNKSNYQGQGYGRKLYISVAVEAKRMGLTFTSDYQNDIKNKAKFIWNSLVNDGLAVYANEKFRFINEKLP